MKYNKKTHWELLKYAQDLKKQGKFISSESRKDYLRYSVMMSNHLHWENRNHYFDLIERFLNGEGTLLAFDKRYKLIEKTAMRLQADLILLEPNEKADGFEELISDISGAYEVCNSDPEDRADYEISEKRLKEIVQTDFIEMKNGYP